jgi:hypothetical protein
MFCVAQVQATAKGSFLVQGSPVECLAVTEGDQLSSMPVMIRYKWQHLEKDYKYEHNVLEIEAIGTYNMPDLQSN